MTRSKVKKKTIIILLVSLGIVLALLAAALIFYFTSPIPMACRFRDAVETNDNAAFYDCIDPDDHPFVRRIQAATGASPSRLIQYATNTTQISSEEKITYRLVGYRRSGNYAYLSLQGSIPDGTKWDAELVCVNRDGTWYVSIKTGETK